MQIGDPNKGLSFKKEKTNQSHKINEFGELEIIEKKNYDAVQEEEDEDNYQGEGFSFQNDGQKLHGAP